LALLALLAPPPPPATIYAQVAVNKTGWPDKTMSKRHPRLAKIHRNHTVEEVASVLAVHRNTVR
jgi:hypothetical protein